MLAELLHNQETKQNLLKNWHKNSIYRSLQDLAVTLYHTKVSSNAGSDLNENSGRLTDLAKKIARIGGFTYPYSRHPSPPSYKQFIINRYT